ncbi:hypothetical protein BX600DRAFT_510061 [Xylariales sp. PMI_506]|nr:hypothetical protein BX600DRAFT_510061 [Xylariales sp. PMI_506]
MSDIQQLRPPAGDFLYFPFLPKELRDLIWEYAAFPTSQGIHFFQLVTTSTQNDGRWETQCHLEVPRQTGPPGLLSHYPSSYLSGLGVWDACCESRHRLEQLWQSADMFGSILAARNFIPEGELPYKALPNWAGEAPSSCNCSYGHHGPIAPSRPPRPLLLNLEEDVVCLNLDLSKIKFYHDGRELLAIPELKALSEASTSHLALEFDPRWDQDEPDGITCDEADILADVIKTLTEPSCFPYLKCLYFIDYRITPRAGTGPLDKIEGVDVFKGQGKTFYEVQLEDGAWDIADDHPFELVEQLSEARLADQDEIDSDDDESEAESAQDEAELDHDEELETHPPEDWEYLDDVVDDTESESDSTDEDKTGDDEQATKQEGRCAFKVLACVSSVY